MLSAVMLNVVVLNVDMLSVAGPFWLFFSKNWDFFLSFGHTAHKQNGRLKKATEKVLLFLENFFRLFFLKVFWARLVSTRLDPTRPDPTRPDDVLELIPHKFVAEGKKDGAATLVVRTFVLLPFGFAG
jgi:hypothetical protein